jgi:hypothetical protein
VIYSDDNLSDSESNKSDNSLSDSNYNPRSTNSIIKGRNSPKLSDNSIDISYLGKRKTDRGELGGDVRDYKWLEGKVHRDDEGFQRYIAK